MQRVMRLFFIVLLSHLLVSGLRAQTTSGSIAGTVSQIRLGRRLEARQSRSSRVRRALR
jgi:hypothetical protein